MVIATLICDVTERVQTERVHYCVKFRGVPHAFYVPKNLAMEILGFVNMNKTERITYAFNMRAPGGRYYVSEYPKVLEKIYQNQAF